ncbi:Putative protein [Zobellia galactanivorans]|uniref:Uncharacterized protein n=1 Tax=Zobellia galactanivorans (strain DSM 12802 / CCUG 47099 / CIP 106680 / NCIMB 13871 / Dsij) TaxID=63186 RepID=G0L0D3_ZOBGA|nr:Putative protein [Zobellia galactanivorans]
MVALQQSEKALHGIGSVDYLAYRRGIRSRMDRQMCRPKQKERHCRMGRKWKSFDINHNNRNRFTLLSKKAPTLGAFS